MEAQVGDDTAVVDQPFQSLRCIAVAHHVHAIELLAGAGAFGMRAQYRYPESLGQDRRFLFKYMPQLEAYFHYRYLDVSTLKELARRWKPEILDGFKKQGTHQAMDDIRESVAELAYYREHFIKL